LVVLLQHSTNHIVEDATVLEISQLHLGVESGQRLKSFATADLKQQQIIPSDLIARWMERHS